MTPIDLTIPTQDSAAARDTPLRRLVVETMFERGLTLEDVAVGGGLSIATVAAAMPVRHDDALEQVLLRHFRRLSDADKDLVVADLARMATATETAPVRV